MNDHHVIVIGAGVAGLTCARELVRRDFRCTVLERSRGVGGRCATRRVADGQPVDHGVPFLHGSSAAFCAALAETEPGVETRPWPVEVRGPRLACQPDAFVSGRMRCAPRPGVNAFPKMLAKGLDVRREHPVSGIAADGDALRVSVGNADFGRARVVIVATHAPAALRLLEPAAAAWSGARDVLGFLSGLTPLSALTVIAGYERAPSELGFDIWYPIESPLLHTIANDATKRENARWTTLVLQARPGFSAEYVAADPAEWEAEILREAADLLGPWAASPAWTEQHRWRAARVRPKEVRGQAGWIETPGGARVGLIGDAFSTHGGLQGAFESGMAMAERIAGLEGWGV